MADSIALEGIQNAGLSTVPGRTGVRTPGLTLRMKPKG
jgi:hypothetical protein